MENDSRVTMILTKVFTCFSFQEINYDSPRGGVSVITEKGDVTTSYLLIQRAKSSDSGQYTCSPSNANPKTIQVHILKGSSLYFLIKICRNKHSLFLNGVELCWAGFSFAHLLILRVYSSFSDGNEHWAGMYSQTCFGN